MSELCRVCLKRNGSKNPATVTYEGEKYCTSCERRWILGRRWADELMGGVAKRLREAVKSGGFSFREIAQWAGISEQALGSYVRLESPAPLKLETFARICTAAGVYPDEVLGHVDQGTRRLRSTETHSERNAQLRERRVWLFEALRIQEQGGSIQDLIRSMDLIAKL